MPKCGGKGLGRAHITGLSSLLMIVVTVGAVAVQTVDAVDTRKVWWCAANVAAT